MSESKALEVKNLFFRYPTKIHRQRGLRDLFVQTLSGKLRRNSHDVRVVLDDISFSATAGDRIALIGRNGAGKSTLCRIISKIYRPYAGQVIVKGQVRSVLDPNAVLYPDLTGRENANVLFQLLYGNLTNKKLWFFSKHNELNENLQINEGLDLLNQALDFSELGGNLDTAIRTYSTGMRARLLLSIAASLPAEILLLDEVYDGADVDFQRKIRQKMNSLIEKTQVTFLVSHSEERCRELCNRGIVLENGKILFDGDIKKAFSEYNSIFRSPHQ